MARYLLQPSTLILLAANLTPLVGVILWVFKSLKCALFEFQGKGFAASGAYEASLMTNGLNGFVL